MLNLTRTGASDADECERTQELILRKCSSDLRVDIDTVLDQHDHRSGADGCMDERSAIDAGQHFAREQQIVGRTLAICRLAQDSRRSKRVIAEQRAANLIAVFTHMLEIGTAHDRNARTLLRERSAKERTHGSCTDDEDRRLCLRHR
jgi:hypothetical protein